MVDADPIAGREPNATLNAGCKIQDSGFNPALHLEF